MNRIGTRNDRMENTQDLDEYIMTTPVYDLVIMCQVMMTMMVMMMMMMTGVLRPLLCTW